MRKIILYAAISLDGKIAKSDGSVDWLEDLPNPEKSDHDYTEFISEIDATVMGNTTYQQVKGFDVPFPYKGLTNYVLTRDKTLTKDENVSFVHENPIDFVRQLKEQKGKDIWLIGGAAIANLFLKHHLIDEWRLFIIPIILGEGISLFAEHTPPNWLTLVSSKAYSTGAVCLTYQNKND